MKIKIFTLVLLATITVGCNKEELPYVERGSKDISTKTETECPAAGTNRLVIMTFGQSNSANSAQTLHESSGNVHNFYNSKCYHAADPLLGTGGYSGTVWSRLGDLMFDNYDSVVIASFGIPATSVSQWAEGGVHNHIISEVVEDMKVNGMSPDYILWHQGESDVEHTTTQQYYDRFLSIRKTIRDHNITAPIFVAKASICQVVPNIYNKMIIDAQQKLIEDFDDILEGPNTDTLGFEWRHDDCHFSSVGVWEHAYLWKEAFTNAGI